jgi:hypothetical protein
MVIVKSHVVRFFEDHVDPATGVAINDSERTEYSARLTVEQAVAFIRHTGATFAPLSQKATDPEGSQLVDWTTCERESISHEIVSATDHEFFAIVAGVNA